MPYGRSMVISGLSPLLGQIANLRSPEARKVRRSAMMAASMPVLKNARNLVNFETGLLRKSLGRKVRLYRSGTTIVVIIGPRSGFKQEVQRRSGFTMSNPTRYAHIVEKRFRWLERAEEQSREQVMSNLKEKLRAGIERFGR